RPRPRSIAPPHKRGSVKSTGTSCASSTRASIAFENFLRRMMDCRVKPGNDDTPSRKMRNLRSLAARLAGDRRSRQLRLARFPDERVVERIPRPLDVGGGGPLGLLGHANAREKARDARMDGGLDELVVLDVELRD